VTNQKIVCRTARSEKAGQKTWLGAILPAILCVLNDGFDDCSNWGISTLEASTGKCASGAVTARNSSDKARQSGLSKEGVGLAQGSRGGR
jgi:hypothetical protein